MRINGAKALVTGANRGIGQAFTRSLLEHGAAKVYAAVRDPASISDRRLIPLRLDVTDPEQVTAAAAAAGDVSIVVNNAGVGGGPQLFDGSLDGARREMEVNFFGTWSISRAFAPVLAANGGGALVNMLSVASWRSMVAGPGYSASKSAQWSLTNALRLDLDTQGTLVVGVHCGFVDTDLSSWVVDEPKISAASVVQQAMRAVLEDQPEVLADGLARYVKAQLSEGVQVQDAMVIS
jgi:NAD(P)-dependent dehydrogenase (short-subunit alcohol dehydrogenase family)